MSGQKLIDTGAHGRYLLVQAIRICRFHLFADDLVVGKNVLSPGRTEAG